MGNAESGAQSSRSDLNKTFVKGEKALLEELDSRLNQNASFTNNLNGKSNHHRNGTEKQIKLPNLDISQIKLATENFEVMSIDNLESVDIHLPKTQRQNTFILKSKLENSERFDLSTTPEMHDPNRELQLNDLEPETEVQEPIAKHIMTLQQFEQGLLNILESYPGPQEKQDDFDLEEQENDPDPAQVIDQINAENEILQSELITETNRRKELQDIIGDLKEDVKRKELTLDILSKVKTENDELLKTQAFLLTELKKFTKTDYSSEMKLGFNSYLINFDQSSCTSRSEVDQSVKIEELKKKYK